MTKEAEKLEKMLSDFEKAHPDAGKNFRTLLGETPALKANLLSAIGKGNLDSIDVMPAGAPAGAIGAYRATDKSLRISEPMLQGVDKDPKLANTMRMVLTHESEHAINKQAIEKAEGDFKKNLEAVSKGPSPHDYTAVLKGKADSDRLREATDQIGGFNAIAAHVRKANPGATPAQLYDKLYHSSPEMEPYFDVSGTAPNQKYAPKAGLALDKDGQLAKTPANIEAMAKHFYDARPYQQIYGVQALKQALAIEGAQQAHDAAGNPKYKAPDVQVNLKALGLDGLGIAFGPGITDTSPRVAPAPTTPAPTTPTPTDPAPSGQAPSGQAPSGQAPGGQSAPTDRAASAREPEKAALFVQSNAALEQLGLRSGLGLRSDYDAVAAAMAVKAQHDGLERIDAVIASRDGKGLIAVQGDPSTPQAKTSYVDTAMAAAQPPEQSLAQLQREQPQATVAQPAQQASAPTR